MRETKSCPRSNHSVEEQGLGSFVTALTSIGICPTAEVALWGHSFFFVHFFPPCLPSFHPPPPLPVLQIKLRGFHMLGKFPTTEFQCHPPQLFPAPLKIFILIIFCVYKCNVFAMMCLGQSEDNFQELVLVFHHGIQRSSPGYLGWHQAIAFTL